MPHLSMRLSLFYTAAATIIYCCRLANGGDGDTLYVPNCDGVLAMVVLPGAAEYLTRQTHSWNHISKHSRFEIMRNNAYLVCYWLILASSGRKLQHVGADCGRSAHLLRSPSRGGVLSLRGTAYSICPCSIRYNALLRLPAGYCIS